MGRVIKFENMEARRLLSKAGVDHTLLEENYLSSITKSITLIKEKNEGRFNDSHILPIVNLLDNNWLPEDVSFAIDPAFGTP